MASAYRTHSTRTGELNRVALRDLGAAEENMFLQAAALGLAMHQMAGFDHERLGRSLLAPGFAPGTMIAIGYPRDAEPAPDTPPSTPAAARLRLPLNEFVFGAQWGEPAGALVSQPAIR